MTYLAKIGELTLKGSNLKEFENLLVQNTKKYLTGFVMINNNIKQIMENYGVKKIDCLNKPFDPAYHQAIEVVEVEGVEPNIVVAVIAEGYLYKDRVLRPSMVKVSK